MLLTSPFILYLLCVIMDKITLLSDIVTNQRHVYFQALINDEYSIVRFFNSIEDDENPVISFDQPLDKEFVSRCKNPTHLILGRHHYFVLDSGIVHMYNTTTCRLTDTEFPPNVVFIGANKNDNQIIALTENGDCWTKFLGSDQPIRHEIPNLRVSSIDLESWVAIDFDGNAHDLQISRKPIKVIGHIDKLDNSFTEIVADGIIKSDSVVYDTDNSVVVCDNIKFAVCNYKGRSNSRRVITVDKNNVFVNFISENNRTPIDSRALTGDVVGLQMYQSMLTIKLDDNNVYFAHLHNNTIVVDAVVRCLNRRFLNTKSSSVAV